MKKMTISDAGLALIKKFEGCRLKAYRCPAGVWTIGYGHTTDVQEGMTITQEMAEQLLRDDVERVEGQLNGLGLNLRQGQFDALASFVFNLGIGKFNVSTLKKKVVALSALEDEVVEELKRWVYADGSVQAGLVIRREEEAKLWRG